MATVRNTAKNGVGTATRVLLISSGVAAFALVAQIASLAVEGPTHPYWPVYLALIGMALFASIVAQWLARISLSMGMHFYAWVCWASVLGMVSIDAALVQCGFPLILFTLALGTLGLSLTLGYRPTLPYGGVCVATMLGAGAFYGRLDDAIVGTALVAATVAMGSENANAVRRLDELEDGLAAYIEGKRDGRQQSDSAALRGREG